MTDTTRPMGLDGGMDPRLDVFNRLLKNRVVMLGTDVNDDIANQICAQLLYLEGEDPSADIWLYINSPGGSVTAGMAIYDTMQFVSCQVATVCMGMAASMGQFLLTAGAAGKRFTNEAASYVEVGHAMYEKHTEENRHIPATFIMDSRYRRKYIFGTLFPMQPVPDAYFDASAKAFLYHCSVFWPDQYAAPAKPPANAKPTAATPTNLFKLISQFRYS